MGMPREEFNEPNPTNRMKIKFMRKMRDFLIRKCFVFIMRSTIKLKTMYIFLKLADEWYKV